MRVISSVNAGQLEPWWTVERQAGRSTQQAGRSAQNEHQWIPLGALDNATHQHGTARCCHCGVVRHYDATLAGVSVRYSQYRTVLADGPSEAVAAPTCQQRALATHWDILTSGPAQRVR
jgi:hypothetical protein